MRKIALLAAAVAGVAGMGSVANADFIYQTKVTAGTGNFVGDDIVALQIEAVATNIAQSQNVVTYEVNMTSNAASPQFFYRVWNQSEQAFDDVTPNNNPNADFGNQGTSNLSDGSNRAGSTGTNVRLGGLGGYILASTTPDEGASGYTDFGSVSSLDVKAGSSTVNGNPLLSGVTVSQTTFQTMATAVVPHGQEVNFVGNVISTLPADGNGVGFSLTANPEPTSLAALGMGAVGLLARRRRRA